jgi:hypothetical protein
MVTGLMWVWSKEGDAWFLRGEDQILLFCPIRDLSKLNSKIFLDGLEIWRQLTHEDVVCVEDIEFSFIGTSWDKEVKNDWGNHWSLQDASVDPSRPGLNNPEETYSWTSTKPAGQPSHHIGFEWGVWQLFEEEGVVHPIESLANINGHHRRTGRGFRVIESVRDSSGDWKEGRSARVEGDKVVLEASWRKRRNKKRMDKPLKKLSLQGKEEKWDGRRCLG